LFELAFLGGQAIPDDVSGNRVSGVVVGLRSIH
jgi:hypothetical protein